MPVANLLTMLGPSLQILKGALQTHANGCKVGKNTLLLCVIYSCTGRRWGTTTAVETIQLRETEGVRENDFYWWFQLTLRNNRNNESAISEATNYVFLEKVVKRVSLW